MNFDEKLKKIICKLSIDEIAILNFDKSLKKHDIFNDFSQLWPWNVIKSKN
jgi:hypothetical protein